MSEVRCQRSEVRGADVRSQMAAEREQRSEGRAHSARGTGFRNEASLFFCIQFYDSWLRELPQEIRSDLQRLSQQARSLGRLAETTVNIPHCAALGSSCSMRPDRFLVLKSPTSTVPKDSVTWSFISGRAGRRRRSLHQLPRRHPNFRIQRWPVAYQKYCG